MKRKNGPSLQRMKLVSIVQRLPFHQQLSSSQSLTLKLTPSWLEWCEEQRSKKGLKHFSAAQDTNLSNVENGVLTLACRNATTATALKHRKNELLTHFQQAGFDSVKRIHVRMELNDPHALSSNGEPRAISNNLLANREQPSTASIKSVEAVTRRVKNERLASSLQRLANTLKNHK